jgi:hypothetical protein
MPLRTAPRKKTDEERRRSPRKPHVMEAWISSPTAKDRSQRVEVTAIDLSRHGVSFNSITPMPVRAYFIIEIGLGQQNIVCEVRTITCQAIENGLFRVGAEFN